MKKTITYIIVTNILIALVWSGIAQATNWYSGNHYVQNGDSYDNVNLWNDASIQMVGGSIASLQTFGSSIVTMADGGVPNGISAWDNSKVSVTGGQVGWYLEGYDSSRV